MKTSYSILLLLMIAMTTMAPLCKKDEDCKLQASIAVNQTDNTLTANTTYGFSPYSYKWSTGADTQVITPTINGTYSVTITDDDLCIDIAEIYYISPTTCFPPTVIDDDANVYDVVRIGSQCWMKSNLKASEYQQISQISDSIQWVAAGAAGTPAWCYFQNNSANFDTYGKLYNWHAVQNGNLCPLGWHIASTADIDELQNFLGNDAGGKMKSLNLWLAPNTGATNSSGFSALPGGYRDATTGIFYGVNQEVGTFWTSSTGGTGAWYYAMNYGNSTLIRNVDPKAEGSSCRCVKD